MTVKGGTTAACAACKYQRRKCAADCQLAPYFPPDQPRQFQNAHRLFGVSNIVKILNSLDGPSQRAEAMRSIVYEANMRDRYPVHGCLGVILALSFQIQQAQLELEAVTTQLSLLRHRFSNAGGGLMPSAPVMPSPTNNKNVLSLFHDDANEDAIEANGCRDLNLFWAAPQPHSYNGSNNNNNNISPPAVQSKFMFGGSSSHVITAATTATLAENTAGAVHDYDEIVPYFDAIDDRQSTYIDTKEHYESRSTRSNPLERNEHVSEKEFESVAAGFSLTSVKDKLF